MAGPGPTSAVDMAASSAADTPERRQQLDSVSTRILVTNQNKHSFLSVSRCVHNIEVVHSLVKLQRIFPAHLFLSLAPK
jgi:hypothetical protein